MKWLFETFMRNRARQVAERLSPWIADKGPVLDYGCGTGHNAIAIREVQPQPVLEMDVANLKTVGPEALIVNDRIPLETAAVGTSVLVYVLNYAEDPEHIFRELRRVTRSRLVVVQAVAKHPRFQSLLFAREMLEGGLAWDAARLMRWIRDGRDGLSVHSAFTRSGLIELAQSCGWELVRNEPESGWRKSRWLSRDLFVFEPTPVSERKTNETVKALMVEHA